MFHSVRHLTNTLTAHSLSAAAAAAAAKSVTNDVRKQ